MRKKILFICLLIFSIFIIGCTRQNNELSFDINKDFEIVNIEKNDEKYILTIKSDNDIREYLRNLNEKYGDKDIDIEIKLFHKNAINTSFSIENLNEYIGEITFNTNKNNYKLKTYVNLPLIEKIENIQEFHNEKVIETDDEIQIKIKMSDTSNISTMIGELKTYIDLVKSLNETEKRIVITVNNTYIFDGSNYFIKIKKIDI